MKHSSLRRRAALTHAHGPFNAPAHADPHAQASAVRPLRFAAAGFGLVTLAAALMLVWAAAASASVWVIPASERAFPSTTSNGSSAISINAARNEYEGVQVVLRGGGDHEVTFTWGADTPLWVQENTKLHRVYYVNVRTPTSYLGSRAGKYGDPLVPRAFGTPVAVPGDTVAFYLLTYVPPSEPAGDYVGTLHVANGAEVVDVPFTLHVWNFNVNISADTAFVVGADAVQRSLKGSGIYPYGGEMQQVMRNFIAMMKEHGISPTVPHVWPKVTSSGNLESNRFVRDVAPVLNPDAIGVHDTQVPWNKWFPWSRGNYSPSSARLENYLTDLFRVYKEQGWDTKAYTYLLDETTKHSEELQAERYARLVHRAAARSGAEIRYLLTDDPRPKALGGVKQANKFLFDDVDIWATRYYYYFGRIPAVRERQRAGADVWWYTYSNAAVRETPSFVVEKPPTDSRARGWLMVKWNIQGMLNWGFNRWGEPVTGNGWRDPYQDTLSFRRDNLRSNGETCLVYPGYYPRYGLTDRTAPPVSSLRLEALRDGLEEREYLLSAQAAVGGGEFVNTVLRGITTGPEKIRQACVYDFPKYSKNSADYDDARAELARYIEAHPLKK